MLRNTCPVQQCQLYTVEVIEVLTMNIYETQNQHCFSLQPAPEPHSSWHLYFVTDNLISNIEQLTQWHECPSHSSTVMKNYSSVYQSTEEYSAITTLITDRSLQSFSNQFQPLTCKSLMLFPVIFWIVCRRPLAGGSYESYFHQFAIL